MVIPEAHRGGSNIYVRLKIVILTAIGGGMVQCVHVIGIMGKVKQEALILFLIGLLM